MSESEHREHESEHCDGGNGEEDDEEDKEREDGGVRVEDGREIEAEVEVQRKGVFGKSRDFRNAIKRPFRKRRKRRQEEEKGDGEIIRLPSEERRRRRSEFNGGGGGRCYVCFMPPPTVESPETPTSDPNSETFSFEMLKALIESNDFYCKECNPHI